MTHASRSPGASRAGWAACSLLALLASVGSAPPPQQLAPGQWGGEHVELRVEEQRSRFEFDCAHGQVEGPFLLSEDGRFDLTGTLTPEGGPTRQGEERRLPARYTGSVTGDVIKLQVQVGDSRDAPPEHELRRGQPARLRKCG